MTLDVTQMQRPKVIVLTPVRDEAWILRPFLETTALWADHIIIADQHSTDGSRELALSFPKVIVIDNPSDEFSEVARQRLLIEAARRLPGPRVLIALDADEIMSANILDSQQWSRALQMPPGTLLDFPKVELYGDAQRYFMHSAADRQAWIPFGYVDDGAAHEGTLIHTTRVPEPSSAPHFRLDDVVVLHANRWNPKRAESKDRWYRSFERLTDPSIPSVDINRRYDWYERMHAGFDIRRSRREWFENYARAQIDLRPPEISSHAVFWWDYDILRMLAQHGTAPFRYLDIWSTDWEALRLEGEARGMSGLPETPVKTPLAWRNQIFRSLLRKSKHWPARRYRDALLRRAERMHRWLDIRRVRP